MFIGICKIEIPRGEWPDIINILISTSNHDNLNFRMASIMTIGYISQELSPGDISAQQIDEILTSLINNLNGSSNSDITLHTIIAFLNFLIFGSKNMMIDVSIEVIIIFREKEN